MSDLLPSTPPRDATRDLIAALGAALGPGVTTGRAARRGHGGGDPFRPLALPDAVVYPTGTAQVATVARLCHRFGRPLLPFGAGLSQRHGAGGICVDLRAMRRVLAARADDLDVTVEAGASVGHLNRHLADTGLTFPFDPGVPTTVGALAAGRPWGGGPYGGLRDNVLALTVVLADGRVVRTGSRARAGADGCDLTGVFLGSGGGLGIITEATLRLHAQPEATAVGVLAFPSFEDAVDTAIAGLQAGVTPARAEVLDHTAAATLGRHRGLDWPTGAVLLVDLHGSAAAVADQKAVMARVACEFGAARPPQWADDAAAQARLGWRRDLAAAALAPDPRLRLWRCSVSVPLSRLAACLAETRLDVAGVAAPALLTGDIADSTLHLSFPLDPDDTVLLGQVSRVGERLVERALAVDGARVGNHSTVHAGHDDQDDPARAVMRAVKRVLDPARLMNPGSVTGP